MTKEEVRIRVIMIEESSGDEEIAHSMEDSLHQDVLRAIAYGEDNAIELAKEALKSKEIQFPRWYA